MAKTLQEYFATPKAIAARKQELELVMFDDFLKAETKVLYFAIDKFAGDDMTGWPGTDGLSHLMNIHELLICADLFLLESRGFVKLDPEDGWILFRWTDFKTVYQMYRDAQNPQKSS